MKLETYPQFHRGPLFSYGTLQDPDVLRIVSGDSSLTCISRMRAWITDYSLFSVLEGLYPVVRPVGGGVVNGTLFFDVPPAVVDRLIWFEWPEFVPASIDALTDVRSYKSTFFAAVRTPRASRDSWSLDVWRANKKDVWLRQTRLAMHFYGVLTKMELETHWDAIVSHMSGNESDLPLEVIERCRSYIA